MKLLAGAAMVVAALTAYERGENHMFFDVNGCTLTSPGWRRSADKIKVLEGSWGFAANDQLNAAIGRPNRALYRSVQDARNWQNPIIIVQDGGVDVQAKGITAINGRAHVPVEDLKALLISLPVSAWPYGRVVAQTDQGVVPWPAGDYLRKMSQTRPRVAIVLKELRITAELWPS